MICQGIYEAPPSAHCAVMAWKMNRYVNLVLMKLTVIKSQDEMEVFSKPSDWIWEHGNTVSSTIPDDNEVTATVDGLTLITKETIKNSNNYEEIVTDEMETTAMAMDTLTQMLMETVSGEMININTEDGQVLIMEENEHAPKNGDTVTNQMMPSVKTEAIKYSVTEMVTDKMMPRVKTEAIKYSVTEMVTDKMMPRVKTEAPKDSVTEIVTDKMMPRVKTEAIKDSVAEMVTDKMMPRVKTEAIEYSLTEMVTDKMMPRVKTEATKDSVTEMVPDKMMPGVKTEAIKDSVAETVTEKMPGETTKAKTETVSDTYKMLASSSSGRDMWANDSMNNSNLNSSAGSAVKSLPYGKSAQKVSLINNNCCCSSSMYTKHWWIDR